MRLRLGILTLLISINSYGLNIFNRNNNSSAGIGILNRHTDASGNSTLLNPQTKQAAKTAACVTVAKGGCAAVKGSKYIINEVSSSPTPNSHKESNIPLH